MNSFWVWCGCLHAVQCMQLTINVIPFFKPEV